MHVFGCRNAILGVVVTALEVEKDPVLVESKVSIECPNQYACYYNIFLDFILECTAEVPCCGDTCSKVCNCILCHNPFDIISQQQPLGCGQHQCVRLCHIGECGPCLQSAYKSCRCGQKQKFFSCSQEYLCESRCQKFKQCGRHQCRKKVIMLNCFTEH